MKLKTTAQIDFYYITTVEDLIEACEIFKKQSILGCDTEVGIDEKAHNPNPLDPHSASISLFQVNYPGCYTPFVIDVLAIGPDNCEALVEILLDENILKIFHYASFDIKQVKKTFNIWINNVRCTQILMKSLGLCTGFKSSMFRGHRLGDMARDVFDVQLDKMQATSQWKSRPLSNLQLIYSALDVGALKSAHNKFLNKPLDSILLRGYELYNAQLAQLGQDRVSLIDQRGMFITAKLEYNGMYLDTKWLNYVYKFAADKASVARKELCTTLGLEILQELDIDDSGEFFMKEIVPEKTKKLLNSSVKLVDYINTYLIKNNQEPLDNLGKEDLANYLEELAKNDIDDEEHELQEKKYSQSMLKTLLTYKKFAKLESECIKYTKIINKNTNCVHAGFDSIGAGTGRMSSSGDLNLQQVSNCAVTLELTKEDFN